MTWHLNRALATMRAEVDARYPRRDKTSDGTIGDAAHQASVSDHNPDGDGSVDAWDMDVNLRSGNDAAEIEFLKRRFQAHPASGYWIHDRRIASRDWGWERRRYTGANPHDKHVHWNTRTSYEDTAQPWGIGEEDMALTADDIARIAAAVHGQRLGASDVTIGVALQQTHRTVTALPAQLGSLLAAVLQVDEEVVARLGAAELSPEQIAAVLRPVLGDRAAAVGAALAA